MQKIFLIHRKNRLPGYIAIERRFQQDTVINSREQYPESLPFSQSPTERSTEHAAIADPKYFSLQGTNLPSFFPYKK